MGSKRLGVKSGDNYRGGPVRRCNEMRGGLQDKMMKVLREVILGGTMIMGI